MVERFLPIHKRLPQGCQFKADELFGIARKVAQSAFEQGTGAGRISPGIVVKSDGGLNEALQKLFLGSGCVPPGVFEQFVTFEECGLVKQGDSAEILSGIHASILSQKERSMVSRTDTEAAVFCGFLYARKGLGGKIRVR
jgi:hypothetical protein